MGGPNTSRSGCDHHVPSTLRTSLRRKLLRWYDKHRRQLPWRDRSDDPYAQWVAEIMLQQTRVDTVIDYYVRFMKRFPTVAGLARARHETVLKHWEGLGYYRRALALHRAATQIADDGEGLPKSADEWKRLPGVGTYTSAAIASIAYGEPIAAVDGNVARVVARLFGVTQDVLSPSGRAQVQRIADQLVPRKRPGDFNQAWMDLGSSVCTPTAPDCDRCPLKTECVAVQRGSAHLLPVRKRSRPKKSVALAVGVIRDDHRMLVRRRPKGGLWSGLWEFPNIETSRAKRSALRDVIELTSRLPVRLHADPTYAATVRHQLTHRNIEFHIFVGEGDSMASCSQDPTLRWVTARGFERLSVSTAHRRIYDAVESSAPVV